MQIRRLWLPALVVAVLADLHVGSPFQGIGKLRETVALTQQAAPDLILLAGDYVIHGVIGGDFTSPEEIADTLFVPVQSVFVPSADDWLLARGWSRVASGSSPGLSFPGGSAARPLVARARHRGGRFQGPLDVPGAKFLPWACAWP